MAGPLYYGRDGRPISCDEAAGLFNDPDARRVAHDPLVCDGEPVWVSTVHTVFDLQWSDGPPLIFETMVFGGPLDGTTYRYATEAAALAGHDRLLAELRVTDARRG